MGLWEWPRDKGTTGQLPFYKGSQLTGCRQVFLLVINGLQKSLLAGGNHSASVAVTPLNIPTASRSVICFCALLATSATAHNSTWRDVMWRSAASAVQGDVGYN